MIKIDKVDAKDVFDDNNKGFKWGYELNEYDEEGDLLENITVEWFKTKVKRDTEVKKQETELIKGGI